MLNKGQLNSKLQNAYDASIISGDDIDTIDI